METRPTGELPAETERRIKEDAFSTEFRSARKKFLAATAEYDKIESDPLLGRKDRNAVLESLRVSNPLLNDDVRYDIEGLLKDIERYKRQMANQRKQGATDEELKEYQTDIEKAMAEIMKYIRANR